MTASVGGYYLIATGGETSNWSQVHRAANELLAAHQQYKIVFNPASRAASPTGMNCTPYVDTNGTGGYARPTRGCWTTNRPWTPLPEACSMWRPCSITPNSATTSQPLTT